MNRQKKKEKELGRRFGKLAKSMAEYYHHLDLRIVNDLDDEAFAYILTNVKGVTMLDLNETEIGNDSIRILSHLEYVKELRVKGCPIDDNCVPYLNNIPALELLHIKNTGITIDGILQLDNLPHLHTLLFSANDPAIIKEKMMQLKIAHPACNFVVDGKPYHYDEIELFLFTARTQGYTYRLKIKNNKDNHPWSNWLTKPSSNYFETEMQGPYSVSDIEYIEINPVQYSKAGKLSPSVAMDHLPEIIRLLEKLGVAYLEVEGFIRLYPGK